MSFHFVAEYTKSQKFGLLLYRWFIEQIAALNDFISDRNGRAWKLSGLKPTRSIAHLPDPASGKDVDL